MPRHPLANKAGVIEWRSWDGGGAPPSQRSRPEILQARQSRDQAPKQAYDKGDGDGEQFKQRSHE